MRRLLATLTALTTLGLLPAPAVAQTAAPARTPAVGGGSFNDAPVIAPGAYRDSVLPGELLFYAVKLQPGQTLQVTAAIEDLDEELWKLSGLNAFRIEVFSPLRDRDQSNDAFQSTPRDPAPSLTVGPASTIAGSVGKSLYRGPGTWYVAVNPEPGASTEKVELPITLDVAVSGTPQPEPAAPRPSATARPAPAAPASADDDSGDGPSPIVYALVALAGLAVGAAAVTLRVRVRRAA
jgi:Ca-activated chloride channel family protein